MESIAAIGAAAVLSIPFVSIPLAVAALVTAAVHLRSPGARRGRCWAAVAVAVAVLLLTALAASLFLAVGTTDMDSGPIQPATSLTSVPAG